jgi:hypothetical protein
MSFDLATLQKTVLRYVQGMIPLEAFEGWFVPWAWDCDPGDAPAQKILGLLAAAGELTEDQLKHEMLGAVFPTRPAGLARVRPNPRRSGVQVGRPTAGIQQEKREGKVEPVA